jgi:citrate synthase
MASIGRLSNSALRASIRTPAFAGRSSAFNASRCYSAKAQTLKERFAEQIPEKVEQIKALRKSVAIIHDGSRLVANDG